MLQGFHSKEEETLKHKFIRQKIDYQLVPDECRRVRGYGKKEINPLQGAGIEKIERIVREIIPIHSNPNVCVIKSINRIERYYVQDRNEPAILRVLVGVESASGYHDAEMRNLEGTYLVCLVRKGKDFCVEVRKYSARQIVYQGATSSLHPKEPILAHSMQSDPGLRGVAPSNERQVVLIVDDCMTEIDPVYVMLQTVFKKYQYDVVLHRPKFHDSPLSVYKDISWYHPRAIFLGQLDGKGREIELLINSRVAHPVVALSDTPWRNRGFFLKRSDVNEKAIEASAFEVACRMKDVLLGMPVVLVVDSKFDRNSHEERIILHEALNLGYCTHYVTGKIGEDGSSLLEQIVATGAHVVLLSENIEDGYPMQLEDQIQKGNMRVVCYSGTPWRDAGLILRKGGITSDAVHEVLTSALEQRPWKTGVVGCGEPIVAVNIN